MDILVNVVNQKLKIPTNIKNFVAGTQEFIRFTFNLADEWDALTTFAQFAQDGVAYNQLLDSDNCVYLPSEIKEGTFTLMLYGSGGTTIATTNYLTLKLDGNVFVDDAQSTNISQPIYTQLVNLLDSYMATSTDVESQVATLTQRIDNMIAPDASDITADSEVVDARIGSDSVTYASLGTAIRTQVSNIWHDIATDYIPSHAYDLGAYCIYKGSLYKCTTAVPSSSSEWDASSWTKTNLASEIVAKELIVAPIYNQGFSYNVGDYTIYDGVLYKCLTQTSGETWTPSHWTPVTVMDMIKRNVTNIRELEAQIEEKIDSVYSDINNINTSIENLTSASAGYINGGYVEDGIAYFTHDDDVVLEVTGIGGGGGGGGTVSTVVRLYNNNGTSVISAAKNQDVNLMFTFTSTEEDIPTGDGTCKITVNNATKTTFTIKNGVETTVNIKNYLSSGTNTVVVTATDIYGNYRKLTYSIIVVELSITSPFNDSQIVTEDIVFKCTPVGAVEKTIHFLIDGNEVDSVTTSQSNKQITRIFPFLPHGSHTLEVYMTAELDGMELTSNHLLYDIMCVVNGEENVIISSPFQATELTQGEQISIPYSVYTPLSTTSTVELTISYMSEGSRIVYSTTTLDNVSRDRQYWTTRRYPFGEVTFTISSGNASKSHIVTVAENDIHVEPVTNDLEVFLSSVGRSNNDAQRDVWVNNNITTTFNNFNWTSNGWIEDSDNEVALRLNGNASATINIMPFDSDLKRYGKTLEIEFAIRDVNNRDAVAISCINDGIGFTITADTARFSSQQTSMACSYGDEEKIRLAFVVESDSENRLMSIYLNGIRSAVKQYPSNDSFHQNTPVAITIGSPYCAVDVYTIRSYSTALTTDEVSGNYIADMQDIVEKQLITEANDIYDDNFAVNYEKMRTRIPVMTIIGDLPQFKGDKKKVDVVYEDPDNAQFNFSANCTINVQGTSSQYYVIKNYKEKFSEAHQNKTGYMPIKVFCMKADYAEATGTHNTGNANFVHTLYSDLTPAQENDERVRTCIYGFPCVIFHKDNESSVPVFVGKYNFNADKGAGNLFGFSDNYDVECWEFLKNDTDQCNFRNALDVTGTYWDDDEGAYRPEWTKHFESRYPDVGDDADTTRLKAIHDWVVSTKNDTAKFKAEFESHFNLHKCLVYYVYTSLMLMVDQRAKNMMWTYWDSTGKWEPWFYDNDTCLGINNEGQLVFDYYHEDTDIVDGSPVYNGQSSVFWNNFRTCYPTEIRALYQDLRNNGKITYDLLYKYFIEDQADKWAMDIYNEDSEYKYISMVRSDNDTSNLSQVRGNGKEHFKYFVSNRIKYFDSKWYAGTYPNDFVYLRLYTPVDENNVPLQNLVVTPSGDITVTPFSNMYGGVRYGANAPLTQNRLTKNVPYTFSAPSSGSIFDDLETSVYGASELSSLGDLSPLYCGYVDVHNATKLTELIIGNGTTGYENSKLNYLSVGSNKLLKRIDVQNCTSLTNALALSNCPNIEEIYAKGSAITGVELADSGFLRIIQLPSTIINLTLKNQIYISQLTLEGYSNIRTLYIDNCPTIDELSLLRQCANLTRLHLTGINWSFEDTSYLKSLYTIGGLDGNNETTYPYLVGTVHIDALTGAEFADLKAHYPYLTITYDSLTSNLYYYNYNQSTGEWDVLMDSVVCNNGTPSRSYQGSTPTRESTPANTFSFIGWSKSKNSTSVDSDALLNVTADRNVYAAYKITGQTYTVRFYNGSTLLTTVANVPYGGTATYTGSTPTKDGGEYVFSGWSPSNTNIQGNTDCYAQFIDMSSMVVKYLKGTLTDYESDENTGAITVNSFYNMTTLTSVKAPVTSIETGAFSGCSNLTSVELSGTSAVTIAASAFNGLSKLDTLIIRSTSVSTLANTNALTGTKIASSLGAIYVPANLVSMYKSATNWSTYANQIYSIEDYPVTDFSTISDSWAEIFAAEENGTYTTKYSIGDTKLLSVNGNDVYMQIVAFDKDVLADGSGTAPITWVAKGLAMTHNMNSSSVTTDGWSASAMRTWLRDTILGTIDSTVTSKIKEVTKTYYDVTTSSTLSVTDNIWIPSAREIFGGSSYEDSGVDYTSFFNSANARIKYNTTNGSAANWWLRSASNATSFRTVYNSGSVTYTGASGSIGVALGFCT